MKEAVRLVGIMPISLANRTFTFDELRTVLSDCVQLSPYVVPLKESLEEALAPPPSKHRKQPTASHGKLQPGVS